MATELSTSTRAKRGLFLPPFDSLADPALVVDLAVAAECAGWDGVFVWDHVARGRFDIADWASACADWTAMAIVARLAPTGYSGSA